jgi:membrane protein
VSDGPGDARDQAADTGRAADPPAARSRLVRPGEPPLPAFWEDGRWDDPAPSVVRGVVVRTLRDQLTTIAAALTFYALLFLFPAAVAIAALLNLGGGEAHVAAQVTNLVDYSPDAVARILQDGLETGAAKTGETVALLAAVAVAVYAAGRYVGGMTGAAAIVRGAGSPPAFLRRLPRQLLVGLAILLLLALTVVVIAVSASLTTTLGRELGLGSVTEQVATLLVWPLLLGCGTVIVGVLYAAMPGSRRAWWRFVTWGSFTGMLGALLVSVGFTLYVNWFADYGRIYGVLGTVVALLTWLWLVDLALLVGLEVDAALDRRREGPPPGV